jgi:hypothetical protein
VRDQWVVCCSGMQVVDLFAVALLMAAGAAFALGEMALAGAEDLHAIYWLAVGVASLRAAVQVVRPGSRP